MNRSAGEIPSTATPDGAIARLSDALSRAQQLWRRPIDRRRFIADLNEPRMELRSFRVLRAIERATNEVSVADVAQELLVDASTASRLVDVAVKSGYVGRRTARDDARRSVLALTASGRRALAKSSQIRRSRLEELTQGWALDDVETLARLLDRLVDGEGRVAE